MNAKEFYAECESHDWYFDFSDDGQVYRAGAANLGRLKSLAPEGSENRKILDAFTEHHFSGKPWGTEKKPKPERP